MSVLSRLKARASYNVLTPIMLLAIAAPMPAFAANTDHVITAPETDFELDTNDSLTNRSTITRGMTSSAVYSNQPVRFVSNEAGATIDGNGGVGLSLDGNVESINNAGLITTNQPGSVNDIGVHVLRRVDSFINSGTITSSGVGIYVNAIAGTFENSGLISGGDTAIDFASGLDSFSNTGIIGGTFTTPNSQISVNIGGNVESFYNGGADNPLNGIFAENTAVLISGYAGSFINDSLIVSQSATALKIDGAVTSFENNGGIGTFAETSAAHALEFNSVATFVNNGTISSFVNSNATDGGDAVRINAGAGSITNTGTISAFEDGISVAGNVMRIENQGDITSQNNLGVAVVGDLSFFVNTSNITAEDSGLWVQGLLGSFLNSGHIQSLEGTSAAVWVEGDATLFRNAGTLEGGGYGLYFEGQVGLISNSGTISGDVGILLETGGATIRNSGLIEGTGGTAIDFEGDDNTLIIATGARFTGAVDFEDGANSFIDATQFQGSITVAVRDLVDGNVLTGMNSYIQTDDFVHIFNTNSVRRSSQPVTNLVGGINDLIGTKIALGDAITSTDDFVYGYAAQPQSEAEVAARDVLLDPAATQYWADATGGVGEDGRGAGSVDFYGALIAGAHRQVAPDLKLGALAGAAHTTLSVDGGAHTVDGLVGIVGLYGQRHLGTAVLDFSLLGGLSGNDSSREILSGDDTDVAHASFGGWFVAPTVGAYVPVLSTDTGEISIGGKLGFIGGGFAGYTETGSTANLTVDAQTFGVFTALVEARGENAISDTVTLNGSLGLFAQHHMGSDVSITLPGSLPAVSPDGATGTSVGLKAGVGATAQISDALSINAGLNGTARSNGTVAASANLGIGGKF